MWLPSNFSDFFMCTHHIWPPTVVAFAFIQIPCDFLFITLPVGTIMEAITLKQLLIREALHRSRIQFTAED
ncbi:hypothetical protein LWI28_027569 [Acer negundo]|uniref:Uncharacterized protein n=1 Tax=Acer negundo TaxID=4023 RepID=A0AAD5I8N8_ACENE|nr:hypothetical protein LWI28_027569 [Acer negundo]